MLVRRVSRYIWGRRGKGLREEAEGGIQAKGEDGEPRGEGPGERRLEERKRRKGSRR